MVYLLNIFANHCPLYIKYSKIINSLNVESVKCFSYCLLFSCLEKWQHLHKVTVVLLADLFYFSHALLHNLNFKASCITLSRFYKRIALNALNKWELIGFCMICCEFDWIGRQFGLKLRNAFVEGALGWLCYELALYKWKVNSTEERQTCHHLRSTKTPSSRILLQEN